MIKKKIFIASDTTNLNFIKKIIEKSQTKKLDIGYKFGLEFFNSKKGRSFLYKIKNKKILHPVKNHVYIQVLRYGLIFNRSILRC